MNKWLKILGLGLLTWLVPFLVSWFFYSPQGEPLMDVFFIKTIMIVVFGGFGALLMIHYFKSLKAGYFKEGVLVGASWAVINWVLDLVVLVPLMGVDVSTYFTQIGLRYLLIPIMTIATGYVVENKV